MRLTGKFALVATLIAMFSGSIMAAPKDYTTITAGKTANEVALGSLTFTCAARDAFIAAVLAGTAGDHDLVSPDAEGVATATIKSTSGQLVTLTATAADGDKKQKITISAAVAPGAIKAQDVLESEVTIGATDVTFAKKADDTAKKLTLTAPQVTALKKILAEGNVGSFKTGFASVEIYKAAGDAALAKAEDFNNCYTITDRNGAKICVFHAANDDDAYVSVSATPKPATGVSADKYIAIGAVAVLMVVLPIGCAYLHSAVDPQGYQAGKDASFIPSFYKALLPDTEYASEEGYTGEDDVDGGEVIRVDPNTGRPIRVKKSINGGVAGDASDQPESETTNAYGVSVMAAALMVPFLL